MASAEETSEPVRRPYNVGVVKIPHAERDIAHAIITPEDDRGFYDVIGSDTVDNDPDFPVGSHTTYRVELTDDEVERFRSASNCRYIEPEGHARPALGNVQLPGATSLKFMGASFARADVWHGRDVNVAVLDSGTTAAVRSYMGWTLVARSVLGPTDPGAAEAITNHGSLSASNAVPMGGRLLDALISGPDGNASYSVMAAAMRWAVDNGAKIVNLSYSGDSGASVLTDAITYLRDRGAHLYASAGNESLTSIGFPAAYSTAYSNVHSVIAWDALSNVRASFSNHSADASGCAPGNNVLGLLPDASVTAWWGTSAAAPHVAQLCARAATGGKFTIDQAAAALDASVRNTGQPAADQGHGAYDLNAALTALNAFTGLPALPYRQNLCPNPSIETATTGYAVSSVRTGLTGSAIGTSSTITAAAGTSYAFANLTGNGTTSTSPDLVITLPTSAALTAGQTYTFSAHLNAQTFDPKAELIARWENAAGTNLGEITSGQVMFDPWEWMRVRVTGAAPAGATRAAVRMAVYGATETSARAFRVDGVLYEQATDLGDYFDGATTGATWSGTAQASTSSWGTAPPAAPSMTVRSSASAGVSGSTITITRPTGVTAGDLLVAILGCDSDGTATAFGPSAGNTGWTQSLPDGSATGRPRGRVFWKVATASEPTNYAFTAPSAATSESTGVVVALTGVNTTSPIQVSANWNYGLGGAGATAPAITMTGPGAELCAFISDNMSATTGNFVVVGGAATPTMTEIIDVAPGQWLGVAVDWVAASVGAQPARTANFNSTIAAREWTAVSLAINGIAPTVPATATLSGSGSLTAVATTVSTKPVSQIIDNFDDNSIDATKWTTYGTVAESGGKARTTAPAGGGFSGYSARGRFLLQGSQIFAQIAPPSLENSTSAYAGISLYSVGSGYTTWCRIYVDAAGTIGWFANSNGVSDFSQQLTPNPGFEWLLVNPWLRLRESGGVLFFDASQDGANWVNLSSRTTPAALAAARDLEVDLEASRTTASTAGTPATFDNLNIAPVAATATLSGAGSLQTGVAVIVPDVPIDDVPIDDVPTSGLGVDVPGNDVPTNDLPGGGAPSIYVTTFASATLSGSGSLTATALRVQPATATLSGEGALLASTTPTKIADATLAGAGALSVGTPQQTFASTALLAGSGALSATARAQTLPTLALAGSGALSATATPVQLSTVALAGSGSLSAQSGGATGVGLAFAGSGSLVATGTRAVAPSLALAGSGALAGTASVTAVAGLSFTGSGSLFLASSTVTTRPTLAMAGAGELSASYVYMSASGADLFGEGTLSAGGFATTSAAVTLAGAGALSATALVRVVETVALSGAGALSATARALTFPTAALSGSGALSAAPFAVTEAAVTLVGSGALDVSVGVLQPSAATLAGSGALSAEPTLGRAAEISMTGVSAFTVAGFGTVPSAVALSAAGELSVESTRARPAAAAFAGAGAFSATTVRVAFAAVTLAGAGAMGGSPFARAFGATTMTGAGSLTVAAVRAQLLAVTLLGVGHFGATPAPVKNAELRFIGTGALGALARSTQFPAVALAGRGQASFSGGFLLTVSAALVGAGLLRVGARPVRLVFPPLPVAPNPIPPVQFSVIGEQITTGFAVRRR